MKFQDDISFRNIIVAKFQGPTCLLIVTLTKFRRNIVWHDVASHGINFTIS